MTQVPGCEIGPTLTWKRDRMTPESMFSKHRSNDGQWVVFRNRRRALGTPWQLFRKDATHPTLHLLGSFKTAKEAKSAAQGTLDIETREKARQERERKELTWMA